MYVSFGRVTVWGRGWWNGEAQPSGHMRYMQHRINVDATVGYFRKNEFVLLESNANAMEANFCNKTEQVIHFKPDHST